MFQEDSRYFDVPELSVRDRQGVVRRSAAPRLRAPAQSGIRALHTIRQNDRLDSLAHEYFQEPRAWWRIVDANPEFLSPREMLSEAVFRSCALLFNAPEAWRHSEFERRLSGESGVVKVIVFAVTARLPRRFRLQLRYNRLLFSENELVESLNRAGCEILERFRDERIGRSLRIPEL